MAMAKRQEEAPAGGPEWLVTYGDMMGLLLAFFIMLAAMSKVKEEKFHAGDGQHPRIPRVRARAMPSSRATPCPARSTSTSAASLNEFGSRQAEGAPVDSALGQHLLVADVDEGYKITVGGKVLFDEGSAELEAVSAYEPLDRLARIVKGYYNKLEIRGHTSAMRRCPGNESPSKDLFDLAYFRGKAVADYLVGSGVDCKRIRLQSGGAVRQARFEPHVRGAGRQPQGGNDRQR